MRTAVSHRLLTALNEQLLTFPKHFTPNTKLLRQMERRRTAIVEGAIDWGTAEALAFASLITQGHPIRLTGQDTVRGTFSHRHLAFHDERNGEVFIPMQHLTDAQATFEVLNSPLSEVGMSRLRVRLQRGRSGDTGHLGGAVRRLLQQRGDDRRPVRVVGARQVGTALATDDAAAARLRGQRSRALERAHRAIPAALRQRQHAPRELHDAVAVLPPAAQSGTAQRPASARSSSRRRACCASRSRRRR